ncbi:plasmid stabilization protein [Streptomyces sp. NPDC005251]|uniref:plasmid stabilization protein n=1 Tax=unclassified Streptomyces TaxID=2593676 RepID=UPI0033A9BA95
MPRGASPKRERQYEHIRQSARDRGESEKRAEEIAARTVNKERARAGESRTASRTSVEDMSSGERGGRRSHQGAQGPTYDQLYEEARRHNIEGRSGMNKEQLQRALDRG